MGTRVFVGGLTYRVRERDLEKFFRKYGRIKEVAMKNGFAFVEFDDYRDADDAVYELNGKELLGERVIVEHARGTARRERGYGGGGGYGRRRSSWMDKDMDVRIHDRYGPPTRTEYRLVVENLSSRVSWQDLKDYMRQAGEVTYADAHKQRRNEGVVEFATHSDMRNAIDKLDDTELNGRRIRLVEDTRRSGGGGGGGGGRRRSRSSSSRSHSRSRSRSRRRSRTRSRSRSRRSSRSRSRSHRSSRSKSRGGSKSKSASRSKSRSRSKSKSKTGTSGEKLEYQQSPSNSAQAQQLSPRSRERSKSKSRSQSRSRSRSEPKNNRSKSKAKSRSKDRSRSRSASKGQSKSKSRSHSPEKDGGDKSPDDKKHD